jgi:hypothetical protein
LEGVEEEDHKFEANLDYIGRPCLEKKIKEAGHGGSHL